MHKVFWGDPKNEVVIQGEQAKYWVPDSGVMATVRIRKATDDLAMCMVGW